MTDPKEKPKVPTLSPRFVYDDVEGVVIDTTDAVGEPFDLLDLAKAETPDDAEKAKAAADPQREVPPRRPTDE